MKTERLLLRSVLAIAMTAALPRAAFAFAESSNSIEASGPRLTLHQAIERALERSPEFQSLRLKTENARLEAKSAWSALLPTVDLQATHAYNEQKSTAYVLPVYRHAPWSNQAGLSINENLYDNGVTWRKARAAELNEQLQTIALERAKSRLLVDVTKAFMDYSLAEASADLQRQQIQTLNTQFRTIESRYRQGLSSNRDYLRMKAQGQSTEISLLSQEIQVQQTKQSLRVLLGETTATEFVPLIPERTAVEVAGTSSAPTPDASQSYEYRMAELQDRISDITAESARRLEWPRVSLRGSYNYTVPQYLGENIAGPDDPYWNLQFLLVLEYRLWDWGTSRRNVAVAENQRRIENQSQIFNRLKVEQDLITLRTQLELLRKSYSVSQQILKANQEAYESLSRGYRDGKISYLELITALNTVYSSRGQDLSLRFNILKSNLELAYYQGTVDEVLKRQ